MDQHIVWGIVFYKHFSSRIFCFWYNFSFYIHKLKLFLNHTCLLSSTVTKDHLLQSLCQNIRKEIKSVSILNSFPQTWAIWRLCSKLLLKTIWHISSFATILSVTSYIFTNVVCGSSVITFCHVNTLQATFCIWSSWKLSRTFLSTKSWTSSKLGHMR